MPAPFTLHETQELLPLIKKLTDAAVIHVTELVDELEDLDNEDPRFEELRIEIEGVIQHWVDRVESLGCEVKGLWLVDFDNGQGYYCWTYPEETIEHFRSYDEGFAERTLIC